MKVVIQRVSRATVTVQSETIGSIKEGLLVFFSVHAKDTEEMIPKMAEKISNLRIFEDMEGKLNHSVIDTKGEILVVSQFTLYGDCSKGNRPSFIEAAAPEIAEQYYEKLIAYLVDKGIRVATGKFRSYMRIELVNEGPTTIIIEI